MLHAVSITKLPQVAQFRQQFAEHEFGSSRAESPVHVTFQQRSIVRLIFFNAFYPCETFPFWCEQHDEYDQHDDGFIDAHLLDALNKLNEHPERAIRNHLKDIFQLDDSRLVVHGHVGIGPAIVERVVY